MTSSKQLVAVAIALLMLVSIAGVAFAERSVVEVPFDSHGQSCWFDEIAVEYHCTWQGYQEVFTIEDLMKYKSLLSEQRFNEEIKQLNESALAAIAVEQAKLSPNELKIQEFERLLDMGIATAQQSVHMNLLKNLDTCEQGMDANTAPFQTAREITKSSFDKWQFNNIEYTGQVLDIVLAIEECKAQTHIFKAGVGYQNFPTGADDYQFSLQDKYTPDIQAVDYDTLLATDSGINKSLICDSNQHSQQYKKQFGCLMLYDGMDAESIKLENEKRFGTDGKINYQSLVLDDYMDFLSTYGNKYATTEDKKVQEDIAFPISEEWKESSNFYQNHKD
tara:strand:+ start:940 stop:1941 length:1002 start_codon:yes stop_codon:yes gene_type:complete